MSRQPKGQLSSWPSVYALDLTDTWPNSFSIPTASMLMSEFIVHADAAPCSARRRRQDTRELVALFSRDFLNPREQSAHLKSTAIVFEIEGSGTNSLNSDGHLITGDSVLPTTAPGGAPERNLLLSNARYFITSPPCARFARALGAPRTAHFATPPLGAGAAWLLLSLADLRSRHCFVARFVSPRRRGVLLVCNENRSR